MTILIKEVTNDNHFNRKDENGICYSYMTCIIGRLLRHFCRFYSFDSFSSSSTSLYFMLLFLIVGMRDNETSQSSMDLQNHILMSEG